MVNVCSIAAYTCIRLYGYHIKQFTTGETFFGDQLVMENVRNCGIV